MKGIVKGVLWSVLVAGIATSSFGQTKRIRASEAKKHIGQRYSVCGTVVSAIMLKTLMARPRLSISIKRIHRLFLRL